MSAWITVYCNRALGDLHARQLSAGLRGDDSRAIAGVDYRTLAEDYGIDESLIENCSIAISVKEPPDASHAWYSVSFSSIGSDPVTIYRWMQPERVSEEVSEMLERLGADDGELASRLKHTREVVGIELTSSQLADMGVVVAFEIARYIAQRGSGVVIDDADHAMCVRDGEFVPIS